MLGITGVGDLVQVGLRMELNGRYDCKIIRRRLLLSGNSRFSVAVRRREDVIGDLMKHRSGWLVFRNTLIIRPQLTLYSD